MSLRIDRWSLPPRELAARVIALIGLAGGALAVLTAILPPAAEGSDLLVVITGSVSALVGAALLIIRPRLGYRTLNALALLGTFLITLATHEGGAEGGTGANVLLYLWICLYAFYFLPPAQAAFQLAAVGIGYAWIVGSVEPDVDQAATQWLVALCSLAVAGVGAAPKRASRYGLVGELGRRASVDGLTGLLNRASFEERFASEQARAQRTEEPMSLLALDVDRFKELNDTLGHPTGDLVLRQVAVAISARIRLSDVAARVGGDEFAVLLPRTGGADAAAIAEELRGAIRSARAMEASPSVSVGVATAEAGSMSFNDLWAVADATMYEAKKAGGDQTAVAGDGVKKPLDPSLVATA